MEIKRRPILTVYGVKRAALVALTEDKLPKGVIVADHSDEHARWLGEVSFTQRTMSGLQERRVRADLYAIGQDHEFTRNRGIEAIFTVLNTRKPFTFRYSIRETSTGISYLLRHFEAEKVSRDLEGPVGANYALKVERKSPEGSVYRTDLILTPTNKEYLDLNEAFTFAMLKASGVSLET